MLTRKQAALVKLSISTEARTKMSCRPLVLTAFRQKKSLLQATVYALITTFIGFFGLELARSQCNRALLVVKRRDYSARSTYVSHGNGKGLVAEDLSQDQIQTWIERIPIPVQEIVRLEGGNDFQAVICRRRIKGVLSKLTFLD